MPKLKHKTHAGFTMVEIMIVMALVAVMALGIAETMNIATRNQNNVKLDADIMNAAMTVGLAMQNANTCSSNIPVNFTGPATWPTSDPPAQIQALKFPLSKILGSSGQVLYSVGQALNPTLSVQSISLTAIQILSPTSASAQIEIAGQKKAGTFLGSPISTSLSAPIGISISTSGANTTITGCGGAVARTDRYFSFTIATTTHDQSDYPGTQLLPGGGYADMNYFLICSPGALRNHKNYGVLYTSVASPSSISYDYYQERGDFQAPTITVTCMAHHP